MSSEIRKLDTNDISWITDLSIVDGKPIEEYKTKDIKSLILLISKMKSCAFRDYFDKWIFDTYYEKKIKRANLTHIIKTSINNKISYREIMRRCFDGIDILESKKSSYKILNNEALEIIGKIHAISPHLCGTFFDYLIRRQISELLNKDFNDSRADRICKSTDVVISEIDYDTWEFKLNETVGHWNIKESPMFKAKEIGKINQGEKFIVLEKQDIWMKIFYNNIVGWVRHKIPDSNNFNIDIKDNNIIENPYLQPFDLNFHYCQFGCKYNIERVLYFAKKGEEIYEDNCYLPICKNLAYKLSQATNEYSTENILPFIFITSLSHTEAFMGCPNQETIEKIMEILNKESHSKILSNSIKNLCKELIQDKQNILLNPALGVFLRNGKRAMPADADLVIDDTLFDIKCTGKNQSTDIYEIEQLLAYTALLQFEEEPININKICIINLVKGEINQYLIDYIEESQLESYLNLINKF